MFAHPKTSAADTFNARVDAGLVRARRERAAAFHRALARVRRIVR